MSSNKKEELDLGNCEVCGEPYKIKWTTKGDKLTPGALQFIECSNPKCTNKWEE